MNGSTWLGFNASLKYDEYDLKSGGIIVDDKKGNEIPVDLISMGKFIMEKIIETEDTDYIRDLLRLTGIKNIKIDILTSDPNNIFKTVEIRGPQE